MEGPCCVGVVRSADSLKGTESKLEVGDTPLDIYTAKPAPESNKKVGVVVIHDIFGFQIPNSKYIADTMAGQGFTAILPDFYRGDRWPSTEFENDELGSPKFGEWFGTITTPEFWEKFSKDMAATVAQLKEKEGCEKVAVMGFCWGGMATAVAAAQGGVDAAVSLHGAGHGAEHAKNSKCPIFFISVDKDDYFPAEKQQEIKDAGFKVKVFEGMYHGFVVRGDFANNEAVRKAADEAMTDAIGFINESLAAAK